MTVFIREQIQKIVPLYDVNIVVKYVSLSLLYLLVFILIILQVSINRGLHAYICTYSCACLQRENTDFTKLRLRVSAENKQIKVSVWLMKKYGGEK